MFYVVNTLYYPEKRRKAGTMSIIDPGECNPVWRKASYSAGNGECIEVASARGQVTVRDSKNPEGPVLRYSADAFRTFLEAAKTTTSR
jgi:hypothetical protein